MKVEMCAGLTNRDPWSVGSVEPSRRDDRVVFSVTPILSLDASFRDALDRIRDKVDIVFDESLEVTRARGQTRSGDKVSERGTAEIVTKATHRRQATGKVGMSFSAM